MISSITALAIACVAAPVSSDFRTWTSTAGTSVVAKLKAYKDGEATLNVKTEDKIVEMTVSLDTLSKSDNEWLEGHLRQTRDSLMMQGLELALIEKDFDRAETVFERHVTLTIDSANMLAEKTIRDLTCSANNLAVVSVRQRDIRKAVSHFGTALKKDSENTNILGNLGLLAWGISLKSPLVRTHKSIVKDLEELQREFPESRRRNEKFVYLHPLGAIPDPWCLRCAGRLVRDCPVPSCARGGVRAYRTELIGLGPHGEVFTKQVPIRVRCSVCDGRGVVTCPSCDGREQHAPDLSSLYDSLRTAVEAAGQPNIDVVKKLNDLANLDDGRLTDVQRVVEIANANADLANHRYEIAATVTNVTAARGGFVLHARFKFPERRDGSPHLNLTSDFSWPMKNADNALGLHKGEAVLLGAVLRIGQNLDADGIRICHILNLGNVWLSDVSMQIQPPDVPDEE